MKLRLVFSAFLFLSFLSINAQNCNLKTNGFYYFKIDNDHSALIRFAADGTVLATHSNNKYKEISTWFNESKKADFLSGSYKMKGCTSRFTVKGTEGEQSYNVSIEADGTLVVFIKDVQTFKKTTRVYSFYEVKS